MRRIAHRLCSLPVGGHVSECAYVSNVAPARQFCPWRLMPSSREAHKARVAWSHAFMPSFDARGPHSIEVIFA
eukprot:6220757-Amphidinium_carterae.1